MAQVAKISRAGNLTGRAGNIVNPPPTALAPTVARLERANVQVFSAAGPTAFVVPVPPSSYEGVGLITYSGGAATVTVAACRDCDIGKRLTFCSTTAQAHIISFGSNNLNASKTSATLAAAIGSSLVVVGVSSAQGTNYWAIAGSTGTVTLA